MENVIAVFEENHGLLGIARDYEHAVDLLIDEGFDLDCLEWDDYGTSFLEHGITLEKIKKMSLEEFNTIFSGFYNFSLEKIY